MLHKATLWLSPASQLLEEESGQPCHWGFRGIEINRHTCLLHWLWELSQCICSWDMYLLLMCWQFVFLGQKTVGQACRQYQNAVIQNSTLWGFLRGSWPPSHCPPTYNNILGVVNHISSILNFYNLHFPDGQIEFLVWMLLSKSPFSLNYSVKALTLNLKSFLA